MKSIAVIIVIMTSAFANCQNDEKKDLKLPPLEVSIDINKLRTNIDGVDNKVGFGLSVKRIWLTEKRVNVISGILLTQTRYYQSYLQGGHFFNYKNMDFNLFSISVPLLIRANIGNTYKLFIESGPSFDFTPINYGKGIEVDYPPLENAYEKKVSGNFDHRYVDFGLDMGVGFKFPVKSLRFVFGSSYHFGIRSLFDNQEDIFNKYFKISLGMAI